MYSYSLAALGAMVDGANRARVDAYYRALEQTVTPDTIVLEVGTGIGLFAMLACRLGARHVYAVEPNPLIHLGREIAELNGLADRITFINAHSSDASLPQRADLLLSDIRGALPWLADHIPSVVDARSRLLKDDAIQIPQIDTVWAAAVEAPEAYQERMGLWEGRWFGLNLSPARKLAVNRLDKAAMSVSNLLTEPQCWATLDYRIVVDPDASGSAGWQIAQPGTMHAWCIWFESRLTEGVTLSNRPGLPHIPMYSQLFFPLERPIALSAGDQLSLTIKGKRADNSYIWAWRTHLCDAAGVDKVKFQQSTFFGRKYALASAFGDVSK